MGPRKKPKFWGEKSRAVLFAGFFLKKFYLLGEKRLFQGKKIPKKPKTQNPKNFFFPLILRSLLGKKKIKKNQGVQTGGFLIFYKKRKKNIVFLRGGTPQPQNSGKKKKFFREVFFTGSSKKTQHGVFFLKKIFVFQGFQCFFSKILFNFSKKLLGAPPTFFFSLI